MLTDPSGSSSHSTCSPHTQLSEHPSLGGVGGQGNGPGQCETLKIDCSLGDITSPRSSDVVAIFINSPRNDVLSSEHRVLLRAADRPQASIQTVETQPVCTSLAFYQERDVTDTAWGLGPCSYSFGMCHHHTGLRHTDSQTAHLEQTCPHPSSSTPGDSSR